MKNNYFPRPKWSYLYLIVGVFLYAMWREAKTDVSTSHHILVELLLLAVFYIAVALWLRFNTIAMAFRAYEKQERGVLTGFRSTSLNSSRSSIWVAAVAFLADFFHRLFHI